MERMEAMSNICDEITATQRILVKLMEDLQKQLAGDESCSDDVPLRLHHDGLRRVLLMLDAEWEKNNKFLKMLDQLTESVYFKEEPDGEIPW